MGASIVKEVATKTNDKAGDGTTTAVILAQAIIHEGLKRTALGANSMMVRRGIEAAAKDTVEELKKMAKPVKGTNDIRQVATISAESEELGTTIADIVEKVGKDGVVTVEESQSFGIESDFVEGMEFDKGYVIGLHDHQQRAHGSRSERCADPHYRQEDFDGQRYSAASRKSRADRQEGSRHHCRRCGQRSAWRHSSSTNCAAFSTCSRSKRRAMAIARRKCSRTSLSRSAARSSPKISASNLRTRT